MSAVPEAPVAFVLGDAVVLRGDARGLVHRAVCDVIRLRRLRGKESAGLVELAGILSACPQPDGGTEDSRQARGMTTAEAAELLGCHPRTVVRLAPKLGGTKVGGRWLLDPDAVREHLDGLALGAPADPQESPNA